MSLVLVMVLVLLGSGVCGVGEEGAAGVLPGGEYGFFTMTGLMMRLVVAELVLLFEPAAGGVGAEGVDGLLTMIGAPTRLEPPPVRVPDEEDGGFVGVGAAGADAGPLDGARAEDGDCGCAGVERLGAVVVGGRLGVVLLGGLLGVVLAGAGLGAVRLGAGALGLGVLLEPPRDEADEPLGLDGGLATGVGAGVFTATAGCEALGVCLATVVAGGAFTAELAVFEGDGAAWGGACCWDGPDPACLPWDFSSPKAEARRAIIVKATARTKTSATRLDSKIDVIMIWLLSNSSRFSIAKRLYS